jgi:hypothetical protein
VLKLIRYLKAELLLVLGTSSSESALPSLMEKMEKAGCSKSVVGLVVPTGYSFNLDGTNIYMTLAALFIAQATNTELTLGHQVALLLVAMLSSKGAAGVTGAGFITLAATLAVVPEVPVAGMALILGVDRFMSECRSLTNFIGNAVATVVVSRWENALELEPPLRHMCQRQRVLRAFARRMQQHVEAQAEVERGDRTGGEHRPAPFRLAAVEPPRQRKQRRDRKGGLLRQQCDCGEQRGGQRSRKSPSHVLHPQPEQQCAPDPQQVGDASDPAMRVHRVWRQHEGKRADHRRTRCHPEPATHREQQRRIECARGDQHRMEQHRGVEQCARQPHPQVEGQRPVLERRDVQPRHPHTIDGVDRPLQFVVAVVAGIEDKRQLQQAGQREHQHGHHHRLGGARGRHHASCSRFAARSPLPIASVQPNMPWPILSTRPSPARRMIGLDHGVIGRRPAQSLSMAS